MRRSRPMAFRSLKRVRMASRRRCGSPPRSMMRPAQDSANGANVLLLAASREAIPQPNRLRIVPRAGSDLTGDWVSNFNWVLSSSPMWQPMSSVIDGSILGWEAASVTPDFVIDGLQEQDSSSVLAGVFYGWLNSNRAYLADIRQGPGRMLVTTFRFQTYGHDPFATMLLHQMLGTAAAGKT